MQTHSQVEMLSLLFCQCCFCPLKNRQILTSFICVSKRARQALHARVEKTVLLPLPFDKDVKNMSNMSLQHPDPTAPKDNFQIVRHQV